MGRVCYLSDSCPHYVGNEPANHYARVTVPCVKFLDMSCEMDINVRLFYGEEISCNIDKIHRLKAEANRE